MIVDKPAGMLTVADEEGNRDVLVEHTRLLLRQASGLGVVHRLDRDTSGLMVFTRTAKAKRKLGAAFRVHDIDRVYLAIAHGEVTEERIESHLLLDRGDGLRGSHGHYRRAKGPPPPDAKAAITFVQPIRGLAAYAGTLGQRPTAAVEPSGPPEVRELFLKQGAESYATSPEEFTKVVQRDVAKWAQVVKASGARPD